LFPGFGNKKILGLKEEENKKDRRNKKGDTGGLVDF
jgi:hypothetical protein